jgi:2-polyprenyl-3-methyl-5-hydroxy-6-metoxy-1,4-benzoquinol methylase
MCTNCAVSIDQTKADAFAGKMVDVLNQSAIGIMTSIGYRTGLFDVMAELEPSTSSQIASRANLNERYVREWLGSMVAGQIVEYNREDKTYHLPEEHRLWLTRKHSPNNIAVTTQWIHVMSAVEDRVVECFEKGGGLSYDEYNRFNEVMADESDQTVVKPLIVTLLPLVDGINEKLQNGISVLDVGCGSGKALIEMAKAYPNSLFIGYDLLESAVKRATEEAEEQGVRNVTFIAQNVAEFSDVEAYDLVCTFDAVHDQAKPAQVLKNIYNALKKGGTYFCQDITGSSYVDQNVDHPLGPFVYAISCTHCMSVSLGQGGAGLGAMWGKELAIDMFKEAGFKHVEVKNLEHDMINNYYIMQK